MPEDAVIIEIAAQTGYEAMRDIITERGESFEMARGWSWEDQPAQLREDWRATMRRVLTAVEKIAP